MVDAVGHIRPVSGLFVVIRGFEGVRGFQFEKGFSEVLCARGGVKGFQILVVYGGVG